MGKWTCLPHQGNYFPSRNPLLSSFSRSNIIFSEDSFAFLLKLVPEIGPNLSCYNRWDFTLSFSYPFHHWLSFLTLSSRLPYNQRFCKMTPKEKAPVLRPAHFPFQVACSSQPATTWPHHRHCLCLRCTAMLAACCRQTIPPSPHPTPTPLSNCLSSGSSTSLGRTWRGSDGCLLPCLCWMCCCSVALIAHI